VNDILLHVLLCLVSAAATTLQVRRSTLGPRCSYIFIAPPSHEELERRLRGRGTESEDKIATRLANALTEVEQAKVRCACWWQRPDSFILRVMEHMRCPALPG
jgi:ribose 1,5-bisphosphokinase PhnN